MVLASELVNGYHKNNGANKITVKVDIAKPSILFYGTSCFQQSTVWTFLLLLRDYFEPAFVKHLS